MGYTHYWRGNESQIDPAAWTEAIADCDKIIAHATAELRLDVDPITSVISFNGDEKQGEDHEQFEIPRAPEAMQRTGFEFCKTAHKPYDEAVTACLARLAEAGLKVSSDGDAEDWEDGLALGAEVLGRPLTYPVQRRD